MHLGRSDITIVLANTLRALKRCYGTSKRTSDAQTLLWHRQMHLGGSNITIVTLNAPRTLRRYYSNRKCTSGRSRRLIKILFWHK